MNPPVTQAANPLDRWPVIAVCVVYAAFVSAMLLIAPVVVGALVNYHGFPVAQAGMLIAAELGAMSLATLPALWWVRRLDWHQALYAAMATMVVGNLACMGTTSFAGLATLRILVGLAGGSVMVICLTLIARTSQTARNFGWWTVGQLVVGAVGLALLPRVMPSVGLRGLFGVLALVYVGCAGLVHLMPRGMPGADSAPVAATQGRNLGGWLALAGVLVFYVALSGVWTYIERIGAANGLAPERIGDDLTIASLFGIAGCLTATALGARLGRVRPLVAGYAMLAGACLALIGSIGGLHYAVVAAVFKFAWTFALPYILAVVALRDVSGRLIALANLMIGAGLAIGPAVVAAWLGDPPDYTIALEIGTVGTVVSLALLLSAVPTATRARA